MPRRTRPLPDLYLSLPKSLDLRAVPGISDIFWEAAWLIHAIVTSYAHAPKRSAEQDWWVPLSKRLIAAHINNRKVKRVKEALVTAGVLEVSRSYVVGEYPKHYRLAERYRSGWTRVRVESRRLAARMLRHRDEPPPGPEHRYLWHWTREVEIDEDGALAAIEDMTPSVSRRKRRQKAKDKNRRRSKQRMAVDVWRDLMRLSVTDIRVPRFVVDRQGRVHTRITSLPRGLRRYLRLAGERLVEIDISGAQPILLASFCRYQIHHNGYLTSLSPAFSDFRRDDDARHSIDLWFTDATEGDLYSNLLRRLWTTGLLLPDDNILSRSDLKSALLKYVLYGDPRKQYVREHPLVVAMTSVYPGLMKYISAYRESHDGKRCRALACHMQRLESELLMRVVARLIPARVPLLTIHDAILCPENRVAEVVAALRAEFAAIGVPKVGLKVDGKPLDPVAAFDPREWMRERMIEGRDARAREYFRTLQMRVAERTA